jgi:hypothetical protein
MSGMLVVRVGRLHACASNCLPHTFSRFAPSWFLRGRVLGSCVAYPPMWVSKSLVPCNPTCACFGRGLDAITNLSVHELSAFVVGTLPDRGLSSVVPDAECDCGMEPCSPIAKKRHSLLSRTTSVHALTRLLAW